MFSNLDRRSFIKRGSLFVSTALVSPSILFTQGCSSGLQVVKAVGAVASALSILDYLGIKPSYYANSVNYKEGSQCTDNFKRDYVEMTQQGMKLFVGIERSPYLRDVAIVVGSRTNYNKSKSELSIQFQDKNSIKASGGEINAIKAATDFIAQHYNFSKRELAKAIALTGKQIVDVFDENIRAVTRVIHFSNALGGYILFNPRPEGEFKQYTGGTVTLYQPSRPEIKPFIALEN